MKELNIIHIYGRPHGHPIHIALSKSLNADFIHEDYILQWQSRKSFKIRKYISWILNAIFFPNRKKYDVFITECVRPPQLFMKKLGLIQVHQKLIALMADESLYFTSEKVFPKITQKLMLEFWKNCDAIICVGKYQSELAKGLLPISYHKNIYTIFTGLSYEQQKSLCDSSPDFNSKKMLFIGNINAEWRQYYKGLDLIFKSFSIAKTSIPDLELGIVGDIEDSIKDNLLKEVSQENLPFVTFYEPTKKINSHFNQSALYIHPARGDSFPTSTMEALAAGLPCLVSTETGTKEIVDKVSSKFITELDTLKIVDRIKWYFELPRKEKILYSQRGKEVMKEYSQAKSIDIFQSTVKNIHEN